MPATSVLRGTVVAVIGNVDLEALGPALTGESKFPARVRFHQAWYRASVLGISEFGLLPSGRALGSVLDPRSAKAGKNFVSKDAFEFLRWRRTQGWGVDERRSMSVMTSSQTLTFNVFGTLNAEPGWAARALTDLLGLRIDTPRTRVEVADISLLRQRTIVDAVTEASAGTGALGLIGWEVKLCDRYSSRAPSLGQPYADLVHHSSIWRPGSHERVSRRTNALFRSHALVEAARLRRGLPKTHLPFVLLRHPDDVHASNVIREYRSLLRRDSAVLDCRLDDLIRAMGDAARSTRQADTARTMCLRYVDHGKSEHMWRKVVDRGCKFVKAE